MEAGGPGAGGVRVLVVDDEPQIRRLLEVSLAHRGYMVVTARTGQEGLEAVQHHPFDIVLLDLGLPDVDGLEVCSQIRELSSIPIIVVSVREDERDKIAALDLGADDYVTKPFSMDELLARIRANVRRTSVGPEDAGITLGPLTLDFNRRRVTRQNEEIHLTPTEYDVLRVLARHAGRVVTHRQLLREVRGPAYEEDTSLLRVHMVGLRQKLGIAAGTPGYIATEAGVGYRLLE
ncbi:MAG: response regulator transcription factor [Chloroflexota bacterium]|nr:response regulator transcription factor [Chloroflexota bacterium]